MRGGGKWEGGRELSRYADRQRDTKSILHVQKHMTCIGPKIYTVSRNGAHPSNLSYKSGKVHAINAIVKYANIHANKQRNKMANVDECLLRAFVLAS